jgi:sugar/nucleoside kinase (ribokinase family)
MKLTDYKINMFPICTGTGLIALDIIQYGKLQTPSKFRTGGSCGNVLTILSYLGWKTFPIARLADNNASKELIKDLLKWGVNIDLVECKNEGSTPIIIHRILMDKEGKLKHKFEFRDPLTGFWLPRYKPVLAKDVDEISIKQPMPNVYYFDRANRASIELAKFNRRNGALIVFEPSSLRDFRLFKESLEVSHIFKFSKERIKNYRELFPIQQTELEIETLGENGLMFRFSKTKKGKTWKYLESYKLDESIIKDSAGAGDWCTAGIIAILGVNGINSFNLANTNDIKNALLYGQALGAINCCFDGARGIMYDSHRFLLDKAIISLQQKNNIDIFLKDESKPTITEKSQISELISISSLF